MIISRRKFKDSEIAKLFKLPASYGLMRADAAARRAAYGKYVQHPYLGFIPRRDARILKNGHTKADDRRLLTALKRVADAGRKKRAARINGRVVRLTLDLLKDPKRGLLLKLLSVHEHKKKRGDDLRRRRPMRVYNIGEMRGLFEQLLELALD